MIKSIKLEEINTLYNQYIDILSPSDSASYAFVIDGFPIRDTKGREQKFMDSLPAENILVKDFLWRLQKNDSRHIKSLDPFHHFNVVTIGDKISKTWKEILHRDFYQSERLFYVDDKRIITNDIYITLDIINRYYGKYYWETYKKINQPKKTNNVVFFDIEEFYFPPGKLDEFNRLAKVKASAYRTVNKYYTGWTDFTFDENLPEEIKEKIINGEIEKTYYILHHPRLG